MNSTFASRGPRGRDGSFGATGATGPAGPPGQSNSVFSYLAETGATSGYPGNGALLWNNATQTAATTIIVSHIDADGTDQGSVLAVLETVSRFYLQDRTDNTKVQKWTITGTPTLVASGTASERWEIPVSLASGTHSFADGDELILVLAAGIQGPTGATGADGADGTTWLSGAGSPSNALGVNGDFYLNTSTSAYHGPKNAGVWPPGVSLIGATGPAGGVTVLGSIAIEGTGTNQSSSLLESTLASTSINIPANGKVLILAGALVGNNTNNAAVFVRIRVQGITKIFTGGMHSHTSLPRGSANPPPMLLTGLTPGPATMDIRWQSDVGTKSCSPSVNPYECASAIAFAVA